MPTPDQNPTAPAKPHRLTLSQIVEHLLQRGGSDRSSVSLTRNAKGATQIDVTVRTGNQDNATTVEEAAIRAVELYDGLRAHYPMPEDEAPLYVPELSPQAAEMKARAERWIADRPAVEDSPTQLARDVLALLASERMHAIAAGQAAKVEA
jgi:hypothetical protein